jgi:hypothetical protein
MGKAFIRMTNKGMVLFMPSVMFFIVTPNVIKLSVIMLNVIMLCVIMLSVILLNVILLNVVATGQEPSRKALLVNRMP